MRLIREILPFVSGNDHTSPIRQENVTLFAVELSKTKAC